MTAEEVAAEQEKQDEITKQIELNQLYENDLKT